MRQEPFIQSILNTDNPYKFAPEGDLLTKRTTAQPHNTTEKKDDDRETKILNVLCNTSILVMTMMTDAFSEIFTNLSKEMMTAVATGFGAPEEATKKIDTLHQQLPDRLRQELMTMKKDLQKHLHEKKQELGPFLRDPLFDKGVSIAEQTTLPLPKLTTDLDEASLFGYLTLLKTNDSQATTLFQQLFEWMNSLPQPQKKEK